MNESARKIPDTTSRNIRVEYGQYWVQKSVNIRHKSQKPVLVPTAKVFCQAKGYE